MSARVAQRLRKCSSVLSQAAQATSTSGQELCRGAASLPHLLLPIQLQPSHASSTWHAQGHSNGCRSFASQAQVAGAGAFPTTVIIDASSSSGSELPEDPEARLTPQAVVERLDKFIIGQDDAKKAVAVAYRNRWRRKRVPESIRDDIVPKNILMIGPTGCGKTEIARRLAKLADSPFVKVEATKFTEVGYHGRDVDTIIKDLLEGAITLVKNKLRAKHQAELTKAVEERIIKALLHTEQLGLPHDAIRDKLRNGELEDTLIDVDLGSGKMNLDLQNMQSQGPVVINLERLMGGGRKEQRSMKVSEARAQLEEAEVDRMFPSEVLVKEAITLTEQDGIVFIDEIDKIVSGRERGWRGGDPSSEGVQRDLLPIIEGSIVSTKHGNVNTDHVLFICSGAFHAVKPSDLMAELQGRLPIRVELKALTQHDFVRILTEPQYNLIKQQQVLLAAEGVDLHFTEAAIAEIARVAEEVNKALDNIGARRLHSVLERVVEEVSFNAPELVTSARAAGHERYHYVVDRELVEQHATHLLKRQDLSKYIL